MKYKYILWIVSVILVSLLTILVHTHTYYHIPSDSITQDWVLAQTSQGFIKVDHILSDSRTSTDSLIVSEDTLEIGGHDTE